MDNYVRGMIKVIYLDTSHLVALTLVTFPSGNYDSAVFAVIIALNVLIPSESSV